jgi:ribosome maturation factor RimP
MPNNKNTEQAIEVVTALADEVVSKLGMSLVELHFGQAGRQKSLEVIIYRREGKISLADCESVSRELDSRLELLQDQVSFFHGPYVLDVASPGTDRIFKGAREYALFVGRNVEVKTKTNTSESSLGQHFIGVLQGLDGDDLHLSDVKPAPQGGAPKNKKSGKKIVAPEPIKNLLVSFKSILQVRLYLDLSKQLNAEEPIDLTQMTDSQDLEGLEDLAETEALKTE